MPLNTCFFSLFSVSDTYLTAGKQNVGGVNSLAGLPDYNTGEETGRSLEFSLLHFPHDRLEIDNAYLNVERAKKQRERLAGRRKEPDMLTS